LQLINYPLTFEIKILAEIEFFHRLCGRGQKGTRINIDKTSESGIHWNACCSAHARYQLPHPSEIRIPDRSGSYRALYAIRMEFGILRLHAFQKKSRKTPEREKKTAQIRLETFLKELEEEQ